MRKALLSVMGFILVVSSLAAMSFDYLIDDKFGYLSTYRDTQVTALTGGNWDDGYYDLTLPAGLYFYFYGKQVTHLRIWTNGYVTLGFGSPPTDTAQPVNQPLPSAATPNGLAAPWWDNWDLTTAGELWYTQYTGALARYIYIEWKDVPHHNDSTARYSFGVEFQAYYDSSVPWALSRNCIHFQYHTFVSGTGVYDSGKSGTIGLEHYDGTQAALYSYNTASIDEQKTVFFFPFVPVYDTTDFHAGGNTDLMIYRPSAGVWKINEPGGATQTISFGGKYDVPLPGDFDGDGAADPCIFRPSQCRWRVQGPYMDVFWGAHGDIPVPADYNGDGKTDIAIFRPKYGQWRIKYTGGGEATYSFGQQGDIPLPYDYDGDLKADIAIVRPEGGYTWRVQYSGGGSATFYYGLDGDIPVPGDWVDYIGGDIGVWRPSDGSWRIKDKTPYGLFTWGASGDIPVPGDFNQCSETDWIVWKPLTGTWRIRGNTVGGPPSFDYTYYWGTLGDIPRCRRKTSVR